MSNLNEGNYDQFEYSKNSKVSLKYMRAMNDWPGIEYCVIDAKKVPYDEGGVTKIVIACVNSSVRKIDDVLKDNATFIEVNMIASAAMIANSAISEMMNQ